MKKSSIFMLNAASRMLFGIPFLMVLLICDLSVSVPAGGQEIKATVTATLEKLPQNKRDELQDFAQKLEQYINGYEWTNGDYPYSLSCQVGVFFEEVRTSYEDRYSGRFYISTDMGTQYVDKYWDFAYNKGDQFTHAMQDFSPLLGLVDHYIYLILGEEMDRLADLGGTSYYEKALDLTNQGRFCRLPRWWDERAKEVKFVLSDSHQQYRRMTAMFETVLFHKDEGNDVEAKNMSKNLLELLQQINKDDKERQFLEKFFNQSYKELSGIANFQDDDSFFEELKKIDPLHEEYYTSNR